MKEKKRNIVWLASYPKSGNTWYRILLSNLLCDSDLPININELNSSILASDRSLFDQYVGINSSDLTDDEIRDLRPKLYRKISIDSDEDIFIKVHDAWEKNTSNTPLFPSDITKGVIYFIRNPLDVAVSFAHHKGISPLQSLNEIDLKDNAFCNQKDKLHNQLSQNLHTWSEHAISWIDKSKLPVHIIKYENMLDNPIDEFSRSLDFLGIRYSISQIISAVQNSSFENVKSQENSIGFWEKPINVKSFFRSGISGEWKTNFSPKQIQNFVVRNRSILERFEYSFD